LANVVEELGLRILSGAYPEGRPIPTEPDLMAELQISRTVLREAVKTLAAKGLVESRTKVGTSVRAQRYWNLLDPTILALYCQVSEYAAFARGFQQIRVIIEPEAAALAAEHRTPRQLRVIEDAYRDMGNAQGIAAWTAADLAFHEAILAATGNPFMLPLGGVIRAALETLLYHSAETSADPFDSLGEHKAVLSAISKRDPSAARRAMKALLAGTGLTIAKVAKADRRRR
jgi:DNA-binding FadR family transcriptional regulator